MRAPEPFAREVLAFLGEAAPSVASPKPAP
jgi:hypothetical protein